MGMGRRMGAVLVALCTNNSTVMLWMGAELNYYYKAIDRKFLDVIIIVALRIRPSTAG